MNLEKVLLKRANHCCEICASDENLKVYHIPPTQKKHDLNNSIVVCEHCLNQIEDSENKDTNHLRCLNDSMWSEHLPVQVVSWRLLHSIKHEGWPQDLLDMMYLDDENLAWAKANVTEEDENQLVHKDSNGVVLKAGDNVVLIKDLPVKGSSLVAKRGTAVRRISLDHENETYIEGKVEGQQVVLLTKFVKKL